jgi:hypothetical protein
MSMIATPMLSAVVPVLSLQLNNDNAQPPQTRVCLLGISNEAYLLAETGALRVWRGVAAALHAHPYFTLDDWTCKKSTRIIWMTIFSPRRHVLII